MSKIAIVTDSTAYLTNETVQQHGITVVPLMVNFGQESLKEGVEITTEQFYPRIATEKNLPTTSQPVVGDMVVAFEKLLETHDSIIGIFLSAGLSGTAHSAETAARMVGGDISVIDCKITSGGQALMVTKACEWAEQGVPKDEIVQRVLTMRDNTNAFFMVDSLEHLHRGGRIGGVSAMLGSLLQVKPILTVNDGKLEMHEKVRTRKKALARVIELVKSKEDPAKQLYMTVVYAHNPKEADEFHAQVAEAFPNAKINMSEMGPVIGTHVGPGLLAIIYTNLAE